MYLHSSLANVQTLFLCWTLFLLQIVWHTAQTKYINPTTAWINFFVLLTHKRHGNEHQQSNFVVIFIMLCPHVYLDVSPSFCSSLCLLLEGSKHWWFYMFLSTVCSTTSRQTWYPHQETLDMVSNNTDATDGMSLLYI